MWPLFSNSSEDYKPHLLDNVFSLAYNDSNLFATDYEDDAPANETITFLCGNSNSRDLQPTIPNDSDVSSKIDTSLPVMFVTHGWLSSAQVAWVQATGQDLLTFFDTNVCLVNWEQLAAYPYVIAVSKTLIVSGYMTEFIRFLEASGIPLSEVTLVGHSLGAQISGQVGYNFRGQIGQIFGLDPAGPLFTGAPSSFRLEKTDAEYVQMILTSRGTAGVFFGEGHDNFLPNGGFVPQPNCVTRESGDTDIAYQITCSHSQAHVLFRLSLNPDIVYLGQQCSSYSLYLDGRCSSNPVSKLGVYSDRLGGNFYLKTSPDPPYTV
ncbi:hypothetical protein quinque_002622 [Culex quinquefasciatus]